MDLCISNLMAASNSDQLLPRFINSYWGVVIYIHVINNSGVILVHGNSYFGVVIAVAKCRFFYVVLGYHFDLVFPYFVEYSFFSPILYGDEQWNNYQNDDGGENRNDGKP